MVSPESDASASWTDVPVHEILLLAGGLLLLMALLYTMEFPQNGSFLSPPLIALAGGVLLWPIHTNTAARALLLSGGVLLLIWAIARTSTILIPFVAVYLLAYLLHPIVTRLDRRYRIPRWVSSMVVTALVVGLFITTVVIIAPNIVEQIDRLSRTVAGGAGGAARLAGHLAGGGGAGGRGRHRARHAHP